MLMDPRSQGWTVDVDPSLPEVSPLLLVVKRPEDGWPVIDEYDLNKRLKAIRDSVDLEELRAEPAVQAYRDFYWKLGIDPTKKRPAGEALARRVLQGKPMPKINPIVDIYNLISAETRIAIGGYNLATLTSYCPDKVLRLCPATKGEHFLGIGMSDPVLLKGNQVVFMAGKLPFAIFPYRDGYQTKINGDDKAVLFALEDVPGLPDGLLERTADLLLTSLGIDPSTYL